MTGNEVREIANMQEKIDTLLSIIVTLNEIANGKTNTKPIKFTPGEWDIFLNEAFQNIQNKLTDHDTTRTT